MGKLLKLIFGLLLAIVLLVVAAVFVLPLVVDPNEHKDQIVSLVKERTGRDLVIEDRLELSVFPWLGLQTGGVTLGNAAGFGDQPFARVRKLGVRVKLLPLLSRKLEVDTLVLEGAELDLQRNASGVTNWQDLAGAEQEGAPAEEAPAASAPGEEQGPALASFHIEGVELSDTRVSWRDAQAGTHYELEKVRLNTGALSSGAQVPVEAGFTLSSEAPRLRVDLDLETTASASADYQRFDLEGLLLKVAAAGEGLPPDGVDLKLSTDVSLDLAADSARLSSLKLSGPQTELNGALEISKLQTAPQLQGQLALAETNVKQLAALFGSEIVTADPKALTRVSADIQLAHEGEATRLDPIRLTLDDSKASGYVRLLNPKGPVVRAKLDLDVIDLDRYLPPAAEEGAAAPSQAQTPASQSGSPAQGSTTAPAAAQDHFATLRPMDLVIEARVGQLTLSKAKMQDVVVKITSKGGLLEVNPATARLYQGAFNGNVTVDARSKTPKVHAVKQLTGIQVGELLRDIAGQDRLVGKGDIKLDLRTVGLSESEVRRSLSGNGSFRFSDGAYKGVNLAKLIRQATGQGDGAGQVGNTEEQTDFTELSASFTARDGLISNSDLLAKSPLLRIVGKGDVNLPANNIDYLLTTEIVGTLQGQGGAAAEQLKGVPIPVRVKGSLDKPGFKPDLKALLNAKAKQRLKEEKAKLRSKIEDKAREALGDKFKGLFGN